MNLSMKLLRILAVLAIALALSSIAAAYYIFHSKPSIMGDEAAKQIEPRTPETTDTIDSATVEKLKKELVGTWQYVDRGPEPPAEPSQNWVIYRADGTYTHRDHDSSWSGTWVLTTEPPPGVLVSGPGLYLGASIGHDEYVWVHFTPEDFSTERWWQFDDRGQSYIYERVK